MAFIVRKKLDGSVAERWEIKGTPVSFGRGDEADVQIKDERMSRQHFIVEPREENFVARDLNSTNGTFVNNNRITEVVLQPNDRIRGGQTVLVFEMEKPKPVANVINELSSESRGNKPYLGAAAKETRPR